MDDWINWEYDFSKSLWRTEYEKSLCAPLGEAFSTVLKQMCDCVSWFCDGVCGKDCENCNLSGCCLWIVGCWFLIIPFFFVFLLLFLVFALIGTMWGLTMVLLGIWPAFAYSFGFAVLTVIRIPWNVFYHAKVTCRTVCLGKGLKCINLLLLPLVHFLIPIILTIGWTIYIFGLCATTSFFGYPHVPWKELKPTGKLIWKLYVKNIEEFVANYGHESGVPENWDGTVYGLPIDPVTLLVVLFLLIYGLVAVTLLNSILLLIKAIPMYLKILSTFSKKYCLCMVLEACARLLKDYCGRTIVEIILSPCCPLILLALIIYIIFWIACIIGPFVGLCLAIAVGPLLALSVPYVALRHNLLLPGQVCRSMKFGLYEPFVILKHLDSITAEICLGNCRIVAGDATLHAPSFFAGEANPYEASAWKKDVQCRVHVKYWDLFIARCGKEARDAVTKNWLAKDEIEAASPNAIIAVPGLAILGVLVESIRHEGDRTLIYWDEKNQCTANTRDLTDNIANTYWPVLMKTKTNLRSFFKDGGEVQEEVRYIGAKLCSGGTQQSTELAAALQECNFSEMKTTKLNHCCAQISDIVLSLLRTQAMRSRLPAVCASFGTASCDSTASASALRVGAQAWAADA